MKILRMILVGTIGLMVGSVGAMNLAKDGEREQFQENNLIEAVIEKKDYIAVEQILNSGVSPDIMYNGNPILFYIIKINDPKMLEVFLKFNPDLSFVVDGKRPVQIAYSIGCSEIAMKLQMHSFKQRGGSVTRGDVALPPVKDEEKVLRQFREIFSAIRVGDRKKIAQILNNHSVIRLFDLKSGLHTKKCDCSTEKLPCCLLRFIIKEKDFGAMERLIAMEFSSTMSRHTMERSRQIVRRCECAGDLLGKKDLAGMIFLLKSGLSVKYMFECSLLKELTNEAKFALWLGAEYLDERETGNLFRTRQSELYLKSYVEKWKHSEKMRKGLWKQQFKEVEKWYEAEKENCGKENIRHWKMFFNLYCVDENSQKRLEFLCDNSDLLCVTCAIFWQS